MEGLILVDNKFIEYENLKIQIISIDIFKNLVNHCYDFELLMMYNNIPFLISGDDMSIDFKYGLNIVIKEFLKDNYYIIIKYCFNNEKVKHILMSDNLDYLLKENNKIYDKKISKI